jgi:CheY-like chemotaxis protein
MNSVLLVDDNGLFREVAESIERRTPCKVLTASNGSEAIAVARREHPDIVFLDSELSGMSGVDVCRVLKADPRFSRTPIVVVTDDDGSEVRRTAMDGLLPRSFGEDQFLDTLRRFLQLFPRTNERAPVQWEVTFWRDGAEFAGSMRDLSRGGFFVKTPVRLPVGARIEVFFEIPGPSPCRSIVAEAIVVRVGAEPQRGLGCRFFRLTAESREDLENCLRLLSLTETPAAAAETKRRRAALSAARKRRGPRARSWPRERPRSIARRGRTRRSTPWRSPRSRSA